MSPAARYVLEALFLVSVAVVLGAVHAGTVTIVAAMAGAWLLVAIVEVAKRVDLPPPRMSGPVRRVHYAAMAFLLAGAVTQLVSPWLGLALTLVALVLSAAGMAIRRRESRSRNRLEPG